MVKDQAKPHHRARFSTRLLAIVALFMAAPLGLAGWLGIAQVAGRLEADRITGVGDSAKLYSQAISGRMLAVSGLLAPIQANMAASRQPLAYRSLLGARSQLLHWPDLRGRLRGF